MRIDLIVTSSAVGLNFGASLGAILTSPRAVFTIADPALCGQPTAQVGNRPPPFAELLAGEASRSPALSPPDIAGLIPPPKQAGSGPVARDAPPVRVTLAASEAENR